MFKKVLKMLGTLLKKSLKPLAILSVICITVFVIAGVFVNYKLNVYNYQELYRIKHELTLHKNIVVASQKVITNQIDKSFTLTTMGIKLNAEHLSKLHKMVNKGFDHSITFTDHLAEEIEVLKQKTNLNRTNVVEIGGFLNDYFIPLYNENLKLSQNNDSNILNGLMESTKKPSYDYLVSTTVLIAGYDLDEDTYKKYRAQKKLKKRKKEEIEGWTGTGSIVKMTDDFTYILTNKHIIKDQDKPTIRIIVEGNFIPNRAEVIKVHPNPNIDLALIRVSGKIKGKHAVVGFNTIKPQEDVYLTGHHLGRPYIYGEGVVAGSDGIYMLVQIPTLFGDSGSGVINKNGELVGVIFALSITEKDDHVIADVSHGVCVSIGDVLRFLEGIVDPKKEK